MLVEQNYVNLLCRPGCDQANLRQIFNTINNLYTKSLYAKYANILKKKKTFKYLHTTQSRIVVYFLSFDANVCWILAEKFCARHCMTIVWSRGFAFYHDRTVEPHYIPASAGTNDPVGKGSTKMPRNENESKYFLTICGLKRSSQPFCDGVNGAGSVPLACHDQQ